MNVVSVVPVEECIDGTSVVDITVDSPLDVAAAERLRAFGDLEVFSHFPRPFFRVTGTHLQISGIVGDTTVRVWASGAIDPPTLAALRARISADSE